MKVSKARIKRASVRGKILMLRFWGKEYGKVVRLKRKIYKGKFSPPGTYMVIVDGVEFSGCQMVFDVYSRVAHPRRALIVMKSGMTPVRLRGKKWRD